MVKRLFSVSTLGLVLAVALTGCGVANNGNEVGQEGDRDDVNDMGLQDVNYVGDQDQERDYAIDDNDFNNNTEDRDRENYTLSDKAAKQVESIKGVEDAYVLTTEENAFVAVDIGNTNQDKKLEKKISDKIKAMDKSIDHVYVSSNPGFFKSVRQYGEKAENGEPIEGLGEEMADTIKRVFPDRK